jgi:polyhydroxyalkanoate synthesis regulator phasin
MERESGEIFVPSASQLDAFMDGMEAVSQPTATGLGLGGSEGVVFGGGQPPMTQAETRAMLQERFGAPTISAILDLPSGQGMGMRTDAQGRMISPGDDRTAFDQASLDRLARLEQRDLRPGETLQERDTRIADSRTEGADRDGEMSFEEARKFVPKGAREKTKDYNERVRAFQAQQNSTLNKLKEEYEQLRVSGQNINNARLTALAAKYQQTEPQKYRETVQIAQEMLRDGTLKDEIQAAMYVVDIMGGNVSDIFDPDRPDGTVIPPTTQLDKQTARDILDEAGGDVEEARRIAKERGFVL